MTSLDILLPFWGDVGYLKRAVDSVRGQTDPDWRLVVVDDAYPDETVARWLADLADPRITYSRNDINLGANANYRRALSLAEADHVVVMGADDLMLPHYVSHVRSVVRDHPEIAVVQPGVSVIDAADRPITPLTDRIKSRLRPRSTGTTLLRGEALAASLVAANWTYFPSLCWRHDAIRDIGFRHGLDVVQDLGLLLDVCTTGGVMAVTDTVVFQYRRHADSDSSRRAVAGGRFVEERMFFAAMAGEFDNRGWPKAARSARRRLISRLHAATLAPRALRAGEWGVLGQLARHAGGR